MAPREFEIRILARYCKGCGLCVEVCDQGKIAIDPHPNENGIQPAVVSPEVRCTGCARCALVCPDAAVEIRELVPAGETDGNTEERTE